MMTTNTHPEDQAQILVVAENLLSRAGLTALLVELGCVVLAQVDGADLQQDIDRHQPDALVVDLSWESDRTSRRLIQIEPELPILAIGEADEGESLAPLLQTLRLFPQFALLSRESDAESFLAALAALSAGLTVIDPRFTGPLTTPVGLAQESQSNPLTAREKEVLQLLARGLTNRAIALELDITQHTVKFHVNAIMSKLNAQSRTEAVVRATQLGMIVL